MLGARTVSGMDRDGTEGEGVYWMDGWRDMVAFEHWGMRVWEVEGER